MLDKSENDLEMFDRISEAKTGGTIKHGEGKISEQTNHVISST